MATAFAGAGGGAFQRGGGLFVGFGGGGRQMPGPAVGVLRRAESGGQRAVGGEALSERRSLVDGGADQRMAEPYRGAVGVAAQHQAGPLGGGQVLDGRPQLGGGTQDHGELAGFVGRRDQKQALAGRGHPADLAVEGQLQPVGEGERPRRERAAAFGRQGDRQLQQRQGVAAGLGEQAVA
ncbi:hypothetical protein GCM10020001_024560 [Nonomuraea salmonea]